MYDSIGKGVTPRMHAQGGDMPPPTGEPYQHHPACKPDGACAWDCPMGDDGDDWHAAVALDMEQRWDQ